MGTLRNSLQPWRPDRRASALMVCAYVAAFLALVLAVASGLRAAQAASVKVWELITYPALSLFAGVVAFGLLTGIAAVLRSSGAQTPAAPAPFAGGNGPTGGDGHALTMQANSANPVASAAAATDRLAAGPVRGDASTGDVRWGEVVTLLRELRDNSLLTDAQRAEKRRKVIAEELERTRMLVRDQLRDGQFVGARRTVDELQRRFPELSGLDELQADVENARARAEADDVAAFSRRVEELMSISAWDRAAAAARQLQERHPGNETANQLLARVSRERDLFLTEQRRRMYGEIQRFIERRRWREASSAARTFIEMFPSSTDSESLRAHLPTLQVNAEIEERQELEAQITDLAKHGRYIEAYNLARHVIDRFPQSPQAEALRAQLPRLKELAHDPNAAPARVRLDQ